MKLLFPGSFLAIALASSKCHAFSNSYTAVQSIFGQRIITLIRSSVVDSTESCEKQLLQGYIAEDDSSAPHKSYLDDGFVFGLDGSGLDRPKGKQASVVVEGDSLETSPQQVGVVSATFAGHAFFAMNAIHMHLAQTDGNVEQTALASIVTIVASWIAADFGSGVFHWSVDNYGNGRTPIMGNIIAAFQGHHSAPWTITYRGFCNNVWKLCIPFGIPTVAGIAFLSGSEHPMVSLFFTFFCALEILSQEFHKWSHMTKNNVPGWVNTLQDYGITIGRVSHSQHHIAPYEGNYCIVSGLCNEVLDETGFFRWMEHVVYKINGVESNSWKLDPDLRAKTLRGDYTLPQINP